MKNKAQPPKEGFDDFLWLAMGKYLYQMLKAGQYATVAHVVRRGTANGFFEDVDDWSSWRNAVLLNYDLDKDLS